MRARSSLARPGLSSAHSGRARSARARRTVLFIAPLLALAVILLGEDAFAQCAMCRTALEQNGGQLALGFNRAILFLLGMPYLVFFSIAGSWYWKRRRASIRP